VPRALLAESKSQRLVEREEGHGRRNHAPATLSAPHIDFDVPLFRFTGSDPLLLLASIRAHRGRMFLRGAGHLRWGELVADCTTTNFQTCGFRSIRCEN
jgi:hypothetical protein